MNMVEKVARALNKELGDLTPPHFSMDSAARAAIEAMREPTEQMAEALNAAASNGFVDWRDLHKAMIDAALRTSP